MQTKIGLQQISIIILTIVTAVIHLTLASRALTQSNDTTTFIMFGLNGLGYFTLLAAYFLPLPLAKDNRGLVRWSFIIFAAVTIVGWVFIGARNTVAYVDKVIEVLLIVLLWMDSRNN